MMDCLVRYPGGKCRLDEQDGYLKVYLTLGKFLIACLALNESAIFPIFSADHTQTSLLAPSFFPARLFNSRVSCAVPIGF